MKIKLSYYIYNGTRHVWHSRESFLHICQDLLERGIEFEMVGRHYKTPKHVEGVTIYTLFYKGA